MRRSAHRRLAAAVVAGAMLAAGAGPASAAVPLTVDFLDGFTFSGVTSSYRLGSIAPLPLAADYGLVGSAVELFLNAPVSGQVRAVFPGQGGQTILIDTGDPILFEYQFKGATYTVRITNIDTANDFGGGLGQIVEFTTMGDLTGSGQGVANTRLPNLGFLEQTDFASFLLANPSGNPSDPLATHDLGVDLNGNNTNDTLWINNLVGAGSTFTNDALGFDYEMVNKALFLAWRQGIPVWNGAGSVNPNFGLSLDTVEWTIELDLLVPAEAAAVPEPPALPLALLGILALLTLRRRSSRAV